MLGTNGVAVVERRSVTSNISAVVPFRRTGQKGVYQGLLRLTKEALMSLRSIFTHHRLRDTHPSPWKPTNPPASSAYDL